MIALFLLIGGFIFAVGLFSLIPSKASKTNRDKEKLLRMIGYVSARERAKSIGWNLNWKHFVLLVMISVFVGYVISAYTGNYLFIAMGAIVSFSVPGFIVSSVQQKRRKDMLIDLPHNARLLVSKLRDCRSVVLSLEKALPIMSGPTKVIFERMYHSLVIGRPLAKTLYEIQDEVRYQNFSDFCDKLITGEIEGFHSRAIENVRDTIDEMSFDVEVIQELDIKNARKRFHALVFVCLAMLFPFLFGYFESQVGKRTLDTPLGQVLLLILVIIGIFTILARDKYLRLNINKL